MGTTLDDRILHDDTHRPWPIPAEPWVLRQTWHDLLFAHWPVARDRLRKLVPSFLTLDTFDGEAWLGITPFHLTDVTARLVPAVPWLSSFNEINVRTYVTYQGTPGVFFFSLDANSLLTVEGAKALFHLPYYSAGIDVRSAARKLTFHSQRTERTAEFRATYTPVGRRFKTAQGTLEHWLTERYCLYTVDSSASAYRVEIHHRPWLLQRAEAAIEANTMPESAGLRVSPVPPILHFSQRLDVLIWMPNRLNSLP
jgi:uncharacterized protein YqjF (DUF2071 family)